MFSSVQIKEEYVGVDDRNEQSMVSGHSSNVDYTVFDNQNVQYTYHQLPHFWDQALHVQANQYPKDFSQKNDANSRQDAARVNQNLSAVSSNYLHQHLQQQQHNSFETNQQVPENQPQISQLNQSNMESGQSRVTSAIVNNSSLINPGLAVIQSSSTLVKQPASGRTKSTNSSPAKKVKCQCEICFKEFGHKSNLFIHMRTHNGERPYKCKECDKSFTHSGNLAIHMRVHSGEKPYTCQVCGKMFSHSGNLSTHLRTHSGVKPYKCNICGKEFRHSGNLSIHGRIHSGIKPFQCKVCGKEFYHSGNLTTHMKKHPPVTSILYDDDDDDDDDDVELPPVQAEYACESVNQVKTEKIIVISNHTNNAIRNSNEVLNNDVAEESNAS